MFSFYIFDVSNEKKLIYLKHFELFIKYSYNLHITCIIFKAYKKIIKYSKSFKQFEK